MNALNLPILAIDVPSGVDVDTGHVSQVAIKADKTITFIGDKQGLHTAVAVDYCGDIECNDLQLPQSVYDDISPVLRAIQFSDFPFLSTKRAKSTHKGQAGHVLVIGGDKGMGGAVRMAAEAAYRVGAGLVSVATRAENVASIVSARPEIMVHAVADEKELAPLLANASALVIGPGLGQSSWSKTLFAASIESELSKVVDADALNLLAKQPKKLKNAIITPHPGEAARLLACSAAEIQADRFTAIKNLYHRYGAVTVLKGAGSLVCSSDTRLKICLAGNPGMATGGMGDLLSGIIAGLLAQDMNRSDAAELAVLTHATAADQEAVHSGKIGLLALDILPAVRRLLS